MAGEPSAAQPPSPAIRAALAARAAGGRWLRFDRFMDVALYAPEAGYYARRVPGSARADYYTAPAVAPAFGRTIARWAQTAWRAAGAPNRFHLVELGPGDGALAAEVARTLVHELPPSARWEYWLVERSDLRRDSALANSAGFSSDVVRVRAAPAWPPPEPLHGLVLANELLDALPIRRWRRGVEGWKESWVDLAAPTLREEFRAPADPPTGPPLPEVAPGVQLEVSPAAEALLRTVADALAVGECLFLDYGAEQGYWTARPGRSTMTAIGHHRSPADPLAGPGTTDLSAFVNFDRLRAVARTAGLEERGFVPQAQALAHWGYEEIAREWIDESTGAAERVHRQLQSKNLLFGFERFSAWTLGPHA